VRALVQYWHSEEIPEEVGALIATFPELNPEMHHLVFGEESAEAFIDEHFTSREVAAFRACAVPAMQADYLRYCAVLRLGGVYADADLLCAAPLSSLLQAGERGVMFGWARLPKRWQTPFFEWAERVGPHRMVLNSLFAFESPGHPLLELAVEMATANIENRVAEDVAVATGPAIFTALYLLRELGSLDAFLEYAQGGMLESSAPLTCEAIGDYERVERAFDGVRIPPMTESYAWAYTPLPPLAYKTTDHWADVTTSIFR
jgi:Glycosyltransferase sugar-binding region containing DXD motif